MRKINLSESIKNFAGQPIKTPEGEKLTLKSILLNSLGSMKGSSGEEHIKIWDLGIKLNKVDSQMELADDEYAIIKSAIEQNNTNYVALIVGQTLKILENGNKAE